ncbi:MAG: hypothetical protein SGJ09_06430 [Phycisphaerae bacterium]|nr:hypothetical protein [Phycisphaerae bacterium]
MNLPIHDWQFWASTAIVLAALVFVVRPLVARRKSSTKCPGCPSAAAESKPKRASITVEGKRVH